MKYNFINYSSSNFLYNNITKSFYWLILTPLHQMKIYQNIEKKIKEKNLINSNDYFNYIFQEHFSFIFSDAIFRRGLSSYHFKLNRLLPSYMLFYFQYFFSWHIISEFYDSFFFFSLFKNKVNFFQFLHSFSFSKSFILYFLTVLKQVSSFSSVLNFLMKEVILKVKLKRTNIFITLLDAFSLKTLFKISGGTSYKYGSEANKEKAKKKKSKFKIAFKAKKKRKDFKKTSSFALDFMLDQIFLYLKKKNYKFIKFFFLFNIRHPLFRIISKSFKKNFSSFYNSSIILKPQISFNGLRKKKIRRL